MSFRKFILLLFTLGILLLIPACGEKLHNSSTLEKPTPDLQTHAPETKPVETKYSPEIVPPGMTVAEKKERFEALVAPSVQKVYAELMAQYESVNEAVETGKDQRRLATLRLKYKTKTNQDLLMVLKPHPRSIAMAQAAMESAWGTSRFFREANNIFGVWSFNKNEPRIAAGQQRGENTIWVKKYESLDASIRDYYRVLSNRKNFGAFCQLKMKTDDPYKLVKKLDRYSEKRAAYGVELASMIRYNHFQRYDQ
ncbi:MAG: hypothetical protein GY780_12735 [bacterium]|nr:hypothetical protein [bacterium]